MSLRCTSFTAMLLICSSIFILGCVSDETVNLDYKRVETAGSLSKSADGVRIKLLKFADKRAKQIDPALIGYRQAAFGVQMGAVFSDLPVYEIIRLAVKKELVRNGHIIAEENEDFTIKGEIRTYWISTETTVLYWDVIGEVSIILEVKMADSDPFIKLNPYSGRNVERTYLWPSVAIMKRVLETSVDEVMRKMDSDEELIRFFKKKQ